MAALVCDLCGGKLVMGSGGIATCDNCGIEHSADRMKEKIQAVKGIMQVDCSHLTETNCGEFFETVPTNQQRESGNNFKLRVDDYFNVQTNRLVVSGTISEGTICVNDNVEIVHITGTSTPATIKNISLNRELTQTATVGDDVVLELGGVTKKDLHRGDIISKS